MGVLSSGYWVLGWILVLGTWKCVRKGWASNHAPITTWSMPGACLKGIRRAEGKANQAEWIANKTEQDNLSKEMTKQHQTPATTSNPSESPNTAAHPWVHLWRLQAPQVQVGVAREEVLSQLIKEHFCGCTYLSMMQIPDKLDGNYRRDAYPTNAMLIKWCELCVYALLVKTPIRK